MAKKNTTTRAKAKRTSKKKTASAHSLAQPLTEEELPSIQVSKLGGDLLLRVATTGAVVENHECDLYIRGQTNDNWYVRGTNIPDLAGDVGSPDVYRLPDPTTFRTAWLNIGVDIYNPRSTESAIYTVTVTLHQNDIEIGRIIHEPDKTLQPSDVEALAGIARLNAV